MPELLAPAGNPAKLKTALYFGADAVYLGGKEFSLRAFADNFGDEELAEGISFAHARGKKVYVCANIFARDDDFPRLERHFRLLDELHADGVLVSDLGTLRLLRRVAPDLKAHISTQANTLNGQTAAAWRDLGASRIVLARELSLREIASIHAAVPDVELEAFVHGATCVSYSGRCYLSDYLLGRDSNRGACAQPCRNRYEIRMEGTKDFMPVEEDARGAYLLSGKDLNLSAYLGELAAAGVVSFKIEGRMKSEYFLATVVNCYRRILDMGASSSLLEEFETVTHRSYTTAYLLGENHETVYAEDSQTQGSCDFIGIVVHAEGNRIEVEMRSRFRTGDTLEVLSPDAAFQKTFSVPEMTGPDGLPTQDAKLVQGRYSFLCPLFLHEGDILRRRRV